MADRLDRLVQKHIDGPQGAATDEFLHQVANLLARLNLTEAAEDLVIASDRYYRGSVGIYPADGWNSKTPAKAYRTFKVGYNSGTVLPEGIDPAYCYIKISNTRVLRFDRLESQSERLGELRGVGVSSFTVGLDGDADAYADANLLFAALEDGPYLQQSETLSELQALDILRSYIEVVIEQSPAGFAPSPAISGWLEQAKISAEMEQLEQASRNRQVAAESFKRDLDTLSKMLDLSEDDFLTDGASEDGRVYTILRPGGTPETDIKLELVPEIIDGSVHSYRAYVRAPETESDRSLFLITDTGRGRGIKGAFARKESRFEITGHSGRGGLLTVEQARKSYIQRAQEISEHRLDVLAIEENSLADAAGTERVRSFEEKARLAAERAERLADPSRPKLSDYGDDTELPLPSYERDRFGY